jgi:hypothetical protein
VRYVPLSLSKYSAVELPPAIERNSEAHNSKVWFRLDRTSSKRLCIWYVIVISTSSDTATDNSDAVALNSNSEDAE